MPPDTPASSRKHPRRDENASFIHTSADTPPVKRSRRRLPNANDPVFIAQHVLAVEERKRKELREKEMNQQHDEETARRAKELEEEANIARIKAALAGIKTDHNFTSLNDFVSHLFAARDPHISSQVTKLVDNHGLEILESMRTRSPEVVAQWATELTMKTVTEEGTQLVKLLRPRDGQLSTLLNSWSLEDVLAKARNVAPTICQLLQAAGGHAEEGSRKDRNVIFSTVICMLAQSRNDRSNEMQTVLCLYLLACGATQSQFAVLNHAGLTSSYSKALIDIKQLRDEQLVKIIDIAKSRAFMIVWDNLNFAFKVAEQRADSKDHFDNGTTATLIPLYEVAFGELALDMNLPRRTRLNVIQFASADILPPPLAIQQLEDAMLWHIENILFERFPALRAQLRSEISEVPMVEPIPLHKTEQFPLPAMHIDESSLDGTLDVVDTIVRQVLKLSEDDIRSHGIILCGGDQLSNSLLDKSSACRRDDSNLLDNIGRYTKPQLGLFHAKMAATRMTVNEHWGLPNSKAPWSLWRMNTLLGRKPMTAGWKAKKLAPFCPARELMQKLVLPANILDAFRVHAPFETLDEWASKIRDISGVHVVSRKVRDQLCSAQHVCKLRALPDNERDITLENIILFNRDSLILEEFFHAIKRGDIGSVLNIFSYWVHSFRGTGSMPKYSDAVFEVIISLKQMHPSLRRAFVMNWLVNLSGLPNGFKEIDLLQEHQNFWVKAIYVARGSNRSWKWLSMISVSIFILRDVIRRVQSSFKTPHNGKTHTSPSADKDIQAICDYLAQNRIQVFNPTRNENKSASPVRDLFAEGMKYINTASAFKNFKHVVSKVQYKSKDSTIEGGENDVDHTIDEGENEAEDELDEVTADDIKDDEEEYFPGTDIADTIANMTELMDILAKYD